MKLLHTSDWHVGKTLRGRSRAGEHRAVLDEIAGIAGTEAVDVVLVGGDLFDTATPTAEAESIVYAALVALSATGAEIAVIGGNHDNPRRLEAVTPLLDLARVRVLAHPARPEDGGVLRIDTASGERLRLALLPFPPQRYVVRSEDLLGKEAAKHRLGYKEYVNAVVSTLTSADDSDPDEIGILLGHLAVEGAGEGGGERKSQTAFDYQVSATIFAAHMDYVALGHYHRSQSIPAACPVRYCGSPLQLDFGDREEAKSVLLVDAAPGVPAQVREVSLDSGRPLRTIHASMSELVALAGTTGDAYLRIRVREAPRIGLADEVRELFPEAVDVMVDDPDRPEQKHVESRAGKSPRELFTAYLQEKAVPDPQLLDLFDELLETADAPATS